MKYLNAGGMTFNVYTKLFESVVEPVLFYCAGIWGYTVHSKIETVLNKRVGCVYVSVRMLRTQQHVVIWVGNLLK